MATIRERKTKNGEIRYQAQVRIKGFPPQNATFKRKTDAKRWVQQTESAIHEGRNFNTSQSKRRTVNELIDRYTHEVLPTKPKSEKAQTRQLNWWKSELGHRSLANINPALLAEIRDKLHDGRQPATVVRYMAALSHVFTVAVNEWEWMHDNPMRKVRKPKEPRGRVRFLNDDERARLLEACKASNCKHLFPVVVLAISTGMRQMEILNLTWADVDFQRGIVTIHESKNGERRIVPLAGPAKKLLEESFADRNQDSPLVFYSTTKPSVPIFIRKHWGDALEDSGITDFKFHDLRHTAASYLAMNGASLAEIAEVLGHKTLQMVQRYAHFSEAHTSSVVASMNSKFLKELG